MLGPTPPEPDDPSGQWLARLGEGPREECGVVGIVAPGQDAATLAYYALFALQHRGQESAGIAVSDGQRIVVHKDMGLVAQVFSPSSLAGLTGHLAVGHTRYSTTGASTWGNAQPQYRETAAGGALVLAHNGNLVNTAQLAAASGLPGRNDSELVTRLIAAAVADDTDPVVAIRRVAPALQGAFSIVVGDERRVYAFRDPHGIRPMVLGALPDGGWMVASESGALSVVGATELREVAPGELIVIDPDEGVTSHRFAPATPAFCLFEWVYLARPDHRQHGASTLSVRREMGRALAREAPVDADVVVPVPDSGRDAAAGFAAESGLPYADALVKNRYVGRTFIEPTESQRQLGIRLKLSPVQEIVEGRRLVVVDDSIVRGSTSRQLVAMLRAAGAAEVHLRISSPPITDPCYYGIDMATREELVGAHASVEDVRRLIGADSLHHLTLDGLTAAVPTPEDELCRACFTGRYPIPVQGELPLAGLATGGDPTSEARLAQAVEAVAPVGAVGA